MKMDELPEDANNQANETQKDSEEKGNKKEEDAVSREQQIQFDLDLKLNEVN